MKIEKREIILNLFLLNSRGQVAVVERDEDDVYEQNVLSAIILVLPLGEHPVEYAKKYIQDKGLDVKSFEMAPCLYLNRFDSEPEVDYMVLTFKMEVGNVSLVKGDKENPSIVWMDVDEFANHPKLMPEYKRSNVKRVLGGSQLFYRGYYKESDGSFNVIEWREV